MAVIFIKRFRGVTLQKIRVFADLPAISVILAFTCPIFEEEFVHLVDFICWRQKYDVP